MSLFGGPKVQGPTRINTIAINQSVDGYPLPVMMGRGQIQQTLLWAGGFKAIKVKQSGKGGKRSGDQYKYSADIIAALVHGPVTRVVAVRTNGSESNSPTVTGYTLHNGAAGQAAWSLLTTKYPFAAIPYSGIAYVSYNPMDLGSIGQPQQNIFELQTPDNFSSDIPDCDPVHCILQVLTNSVWGLGGSFPADVVDNGAGGTWGYPGGPGSSGQARNWFVAHNFFISPVIDRQETAASAISKWLEAGQCAAFMSEGLLKLVPYGDTDAADNGLDWVAPMVFATALDDTCFIGKDGEDPVSISSAAWQDASNKVQIQWSNRAKKYAQEVTPDSDQAAIDRYGLRIEDPQTYDFITTLPAAQFAASMRLKRNVYTRNTFEFSLPYRFSYLEPMDIVKISTSSVWAAGLNNVNLGIVNRPVRITKIVDNPDGTLDVTAEDYLGADHPTIYNKDISAGQTLVQLYADPGDTEAIVFEATNRLTGFRGNEIWMGACGATPDWGGCNVLVSQDGDTYRTIGTINSPARMGTLAATLAVTADPDSTHDMVVTLVAGSAALEAGTVADADLDNTLCYLGGELLSYSACAIDGVDTYRASGYKRRGRMGSAIASHAPGALFMRLDDSVFKFQYDPAWQGKTIHLKFQSVNIHGAAAQDLSTIAPVTFTIPGANGGAVDASTGLIISNQTKSTFLKGQGSMIPAQPLPQPTYSKSDTTIDFAAYSQTQGLSDGSSISVHAPARSITGLSAGTGYYFYPRVRVSDGLMDFANPLTPPPSSPDATYALMAAMDGYYSMTPFKVTTMASGGSGGSGGGSTSCPEAGELVDVQGRGVIPVKDVEVGDFIKGQSTRTGEDVYRRVISKAGGICAAWRIVDGHKVTPCEPIRYAGEWVPAFRVPGAAFDGSVGFKVELRVEADEFDECNYWLVSGTALLTHNMIPIFGDLGS